MFHPAAVPFHSMSVDAGGLSGKELPVCRLRAVLNHCRYGMMHRIWDGAAAGDGMIDGYGDSRSRADGYRGCRLSWLMCKKIPSR